MRFRLIHQTWKFGLGEPLLYQRTMVVEAWHFQVHVIGPVAGHENCTTRCCTVCGTIHTSEMQSHFHWIGLRENLHRKPWFLPLNVGVSGFKCSIIIVLYNLTIGCMVYHYNYWGKPIQSHFFPISWASRRAGLGLAMPWHVQRSPGNGMSCVCRWWSWSSTS